MTKTEKYRPVDTRVLNDLDNAPESAKKYHDMNASREAAKLAERYAKSPMYLKLLSLHIAGLADKAHSKHIQELEAQKPRKRNPDNGQFESQDNYYDQD